MALRRSTQCASRMPSLAALAFAVAPTIVVEHTVVAAAFLNGDIIEMCALPAGMVVTRLTLVADDCDTANTITCDVGIMNGQYLADLADDGVSARTCGAEFLSASTLLRAGGVEVSAVKAGHMLAPSLSDRSIGLKLTAALTPIAAAKIRLLVEVTPAPVGMAFA